MAVGRRQGDRRAGSAAEAAAFGEVVFLAVAWSGAEGVLHAAEPGNLKGKVLVDVTNPLVFEAEGAPSKLALAYPDSAGRRIQELVPESHVVKCFNIVNARLMAHPNEAAENPDMFLAVNDEKAKTLVSEIATGWGWRCHDLGGIEQSYLLEAFAMLWIIYGFQTNVWTHVFKLMNTGE